MPTYNLCVTHNGTTHTYPCNLNHDDSLTIEQVYERIISDFYSNVMLEIEEPKVCPVCGSFTFDSCPACEDYL